MAWAVELTAWLGPKPVELVIQLFAELEVAEEEPPALGQSGLEPEVPPRPPCRSCRAPGGRPLLDRRRLRHCPEPEGLLLRPFEPNFDHRFCKYKVNATIFYLRNLFRRKYLNEVIR